MMVPVNPITSALQQMQAMANEATNPESLDSSASASSATSPVSFTELLQQSLAKVSASQASATGEMHAFELGASNVSLNSAMIDGAKAGIMFQQSLQIRNRLVSAYTDIMQAQL
ncbi:flagellar hook-basal body complex protein FliE [Paraburkholderia sp. CNPSo 3272]|uniref:flagellar hook-basal body complex protein FliE n=1 Tax=Paraburkholderia sp. CNPSo 3272 TaxID=2940931 RepID=UPI0020B6B835|nr:flagellar hook-basal body complex protein FliE [Paraburkholderia sp. CNPSo 3272]MCP3727754.1 flagellar hook-basal body complex protein FliE [Paraburkholderia sp. CNPSo 3272]